MTSGRRFPPTGGSWRSGIADAPTDWLTAVGDVPPPNHPIAQIEPMPGTLMALAA